MGREGEADEGRQRYVKRKRRKERRRERTLTVKDFSRMGSGVTHWTMAISAVALEQLTNHTWLARTLVAHSV